MNNTHSLNLVSSSSQAVSIADHANLKPTGSFTIEGWYKTTSSSSDQTLFQSESENSNVAGIKIFMSSGTLYFLIGRNTGTTSNTDYKILSSGLTTNNGLWTHVSCVYNGSNMYIYINGVQVASTAWNNNAGYAGTNYVRIGCGNASGSNQNYWTGQIDELRLFNDARTVQEIQDNMFQELTPGTDNLVEVWHLNNSLESATGSHNGTAINSPTFSTDIPTFRENPNFGSLDLELSSSQYASIAHASAPSLEITSSQTWEFWIRPETNNTVQSIIGKADSGASVYRSITIDAIGTVTWNVQGINKAVTSSFSLNNGQWYHFAVVYDASAGTLKMYINGILDDSETGVTGTITSNTGAFSIGKFGGSTTNYYYDGMIDEVRIWNVARTAQQIRDNIFQDVTGQTGLQGYWKLNGDYTDSSGNGYTLTPSGSPVFSTNLPFPEYTEINPVRFGSTTLADDANLKAYYELENTSDSSGNGFNLTNNGSVSFNAGKFGNGADFGNGNTNKTLTLSNDLGLGNGSFTLGTWVKFSGLGTSTYFSNFRDGATNTYSRFHWYEPGKYLTFYRVKAGVAQQGATYTMTPVVGDWYHLVITFDGSTVRGYVNGILVGSGSASGNGSGTSSDRFVIGTDSDISDVTVGSVNAIIDDSQVFDRALTSTEIFELYTGLNLASSITKLSGVSRSSIKKVSSIALASVGRISGVQ